MWSCGVILPQSYLWRLGLRRKVSNNPTSHTDKGPAAGDSLGIWCQGSRALLRTTSTYRITLDASSEPSIRPGTAHWFASAIVRSLRCSNSSWDRRIHRVWPTVQWGPQCETLSVTRPWYHAGDVGKGSLAVQGSLGGHSRHDCLISASLHSLPGCRHWCRHWSDRLWLVLPPCSAPHCYKLQHPRWTATFYDFSFEPIHFHLLSPPHPAANRGTKIASSLKNLFSLRFIFIYQSFLFDLLHSHFFSLSSIIVNI